MSYGYYEDPELGWGPYDNGKPKPATYYFKILGEALKWWRDCLGLAILVVLIGIYTRLPPKSTAVVAPSTSSVVPSASSVVRPRRTRVAKPTKWAEDGEDSAGAYHESGVAHKLPRANPEDVKSNIPDPGDAVAHFPKTARKADDLVARLRADPKWFPPRGKKWHPSGGGL
jgi:hypothetical protein